MSRVIFTTAFLLGVIAIIWMGAAFAGSDTLGLTVIAVIGAVYAIGFVELFQYRKASSTLSVALSELSNGGSQAVSALDNWLAKLHPSLQNAVRSRIEGDRVALSAPVITPYLVGLLVMLGLLGTFLGMVDTLKGAVLALEGTTELEAIRAGLAAPIGGLSLAFGTSVAGVAASAMLGLASTISRRDRMFSTRLLDNQIATYFREHSLVHNRKETFKALQLQASALPDVAERLHNLAGHIERMGESLSTQLITNQQQFHQSVQGAYTELANAVNQSLSESLAESSQLAAENGRLAAEGIKPVAEALMADIRSETEKTHQQLTETVQDQLQTLTQRFSDTSEQVASAWQSGLAAQEQSNTSLVENMSHSLGGFNTQFDQSTTTLLSAFNTLTSNWAEQQQTGDKERLKLWSSAINQTQEKAVEKLSEASQQLTGELKQVTDAQQVSLNTVAQGFESMSSSLTEQWQRAGEQLLVQQQQSASTLEQAVDKIAEQGQSSSAELLHTIGEKLTETSQQVTSELKQAAESQQSSFKSVAQDFETMSSALTTQWQQAGEQSLSQQQILSGSLQSSVEQMTEQAKTASADMLAEVGQLLQSSEALIQARIASEQTWLNGHGDRMDQLTAVLKSELASLRDQEQQRGEAAVERLSGLEATVATHLSTLGKELEAPMMTLIQTASETPKAAAEVIGQLRREISNNIERDNSLLEERSKIMDQLNTLSSALQQSTSSQSEAITTLVDSSATMLKDVGKQFTDHVGSEVGKMSDIAANFAGSAIEMSSLGEAFTLAVQMFNDSNSHLIENLNRIEESLDKSSARSDEQLAYYVAQAREIIGHSMVSQKQVFDELHQLSRQDNASSNTSNNNSSNNNALEEAS